MSLCKNGQILNCCHPNALMTLAEYLVDYASEETKEIGFKLIEDELKKIPNEKVHSIAVEILRISKSQTDETLDFSFLNRKVSLTQTD